MDERLMEWEIVRSVPKHANTPAPPSVLRAEVPGGWVYMVTNERGTLALTFVPKPG